MSQNCYHCNKHSYIDLDDGQKYYAEWHCFCPDGKYMCLPCAITFKDWCPKSVNKCSNHLLDLRLLKMKAIEP